MQDIPWESEKGLSSGRRSAMAARQRLQAENSMQDGHKGAIWYTSWVGCSHPPEGAHSYPIKVAPSSKQLHNLLCFKLDVVILPVALVPSIRFRTAQFIVLAHPRAHRGGRDRRLRRFHVPVRDPPPPPEPRGHFRRGVGRWLVNKQASLFGWSAGRTGGRVPMGGGGQHGGTRWACVREVSGGYVGSGVGPGCEDVERATGGTVGSCGEPWGGQGGPRVGQGSGGPGGGPGRR